MSATLFGRIARHEVPAHLIWEDDLTVAFLDNHPHVSGHTLVVPRLEIDKWTDLDEATCAALFGVARRIGRALIAAYGAERAGLVVAGYHVPHVHLHVFPSHGMADFDFRELPALADDAVLEPEAVRIRHELGDITQI